MEYVGRTQFVHNSYWPKMVYDGRRLSTLGVLSRLTSIHFCLPIDFRSTVDWLGTYLGQNGLLPIFGIFDSFMVYSLNY